jgi:uncharacterized protein
MNGTLTLTEKSDLQEGLRTSASLDLGPSIRDLVQFASRVIAPLGPIASFAARNPWMGLEAESFDEVARWLKSIQDVDIYPSASMLHAAKNRGDIHEKYLNEGLQQWLDVQSSDLSRAVSLGFCRASLQLDELPSKLLASPELQSLADKLLDLKFEFTKKPSIQTYSRCLELEGARRVAHDLNCHLIRWCKLFLDTSKAAWSLPNRKEGFYRAWKRLVQYDPALTHLQRQQLKDCPKEADGALKKALSALKIPGSQIKEYLEAHLLSLPGWAGMMLWRSQQSSEENSLLTEYLAVRISLEWVLVSPYLPFTQQKSADKLSFVPLIAAWIHWGGLSLEDWSQLSPWEQKARLILAHSFDDFVRRQIWLEAWEKTYENGLKEIIASKQRESIEVKPVLAQFSFCIDVRSEPIRRELEKAGPFETFGMAGFFGLPIEVTEIGSQYSHPSLPVMQRPRNKVEESSAEFELTQYQQRRQAVNSIGFTFKVMKQNLLTNLLLPEVSGPWLCMQMLIRSFLPRRAGRAFRKLRQSWLRKPSTELSLDLVHTEMDLPVGFSAEEKVHYVRQALQMMGLTKNFAPLVVICGHGSHSTNNPYAAALDCGACGGTSGGFNARVLATLCNLSVVRKALIHEGISIPEDTVFAAAEHVTTLNELRWLYVPKLSDAAKKAFDEIQTVIQNISHKESEKRLSQLPNIGFPLKNPMSQMQRYAEDWSEVRPEWGLARNAAFIIGDRQLTRDCNLDGRVFLHNYDWQKDNQGVLLENIIAGPATVAQWINLQYYASTVAPHYYGSGNKSTQTVTAGLGVMQGNASDLLAGLPWQSVMKSDEEAYHDPLRMLVVVQAPREYMKRLLDNNPAFRQKVQNGWLRLVSIDPQGHWKNWN